jgi:hypothetical protein
MRYNENTQEKMQNQTYEISDKINQYNLNTVKVDTESIFPYDPYIKYNNSGLFRNTNGEFIDKNSEILNITRPLSNNPLEKHPPASVVPKNFIQLKDGLFQTKSTLLDSPPMELRGQVKNRWIELPQNPQENVIEPFKRLGTNTHLTLIDNYDC